MQFAVSVCSAQLLCAVDVCSGKLLCAVCSVRVQCSVAVCSGCVQWAVNVCSEQLLCGVGSEAKVFATSEISSISIHRISPISELHCSLDSCM